MSPCVTSCHLVSPSTSHATHLRKNRCYNPRMKVNCVFARRVGRLGATSVATCVFLPPQNRHKSRTFLALKAVRGFDFQNRTKSNGNARGHYANRFAVSLDSRPSSLDLLGTFAPSRLSVKIDPRENAYVMRTKCAQKQKVNFLLPSHHPLTISGSESVRILRKRRCLRSLQPLINSVPGFLLSWFPYRSVQLCAAFPRPAYSI